MLRIVQTDNGVFDLAVDDPALNDDNAAAETIVYAALFTDAEAPASREPDRFNRRGWWADPAAGSPLWHIRRQPLGSAARREALDAVSTALTAHGLTNIAVVNASPLSPTQVVMTITGSYQSRAFSFTIPL